MSQSTNNTHNEHRRQCLYNILEIARSANSDEIKTAYKKQAKQWHPDRNIDNTAFATIRFKEINEAYEILSDKHERAWYDAHRDAILRGFDKSEIHKNMEQNEDYDPDIDLMPYFNPFIFTSFEDNDSNSFYTIYNCIFMQIIDLEKLSKKKTPLFGDSTLSYHKMKEFYSFWEVFESRRSFQFATKYNLKDASNRKIRKLMHKENRKLIESKRKKWEESILKLIAFIKKRDPRFRMYLIDIDRHKIEEKQRLIQYQKEIDDIIKEEQMKQRQIEIEKYKEKEDDLNIIENEQLFECVVCNKIFKSENAFKSHKSSKKHIRAKHNLKQQLNIEENLLFDEKVNDQNRLDEMIAKQIEHQQNVDNDVDVDYLMALSVEQQDIINAADIFDDENDKDCDNDNVLITDTEILCLLEQGIGIDALINTYSTLTKEYIMDLKPKKKKKKKKKKGHIIYDEENENEGMNEFMKTFKTFNKKSDFINKEKGINDNNDDLVKNKEKKRRRRRKNKNKDIQNQRNVNRRPSPQQTTSVPIKSKCKACDQMFQSKTKLYDHLKDNPKHALKSHHI